MTRRKSKSEDREHERFRSQRITKLLQRGWIKDASEMPGDALPVDPDLINLGGSWDTPKFFRKMTFTCRDCGESAVWEAEDQRWYYETTKAPIFKTAVPCRDCRAKEGKRILEARRKAGHEQDQHRKDP